MELGGYQGQVCNGSFRWDGREISSRTVQFRVPNSRVHHNAPNVL